MNSQIENQHAGEEPWQTVSPAIFCSQTVSRQTIELWALVLDSRSIPCSIELQNAQLRLTVPPEHHAAAEHELELFNMENQNWPPPFPSGHLARVSNLATISVLLLLATFHNLIHLENSATIGISMPEWIQIGKANSQLILEGEWWRLVTALTLHADWVHLSGNLAIGGIFIFFLCREIGAGVAWLLILAAGIAGNWVNALVQSPLHSSVGASTAVFGAVGILAAINMVYHRKNRRKRWQMPIAAAFAILGILGTEGKNSDIGAHLFGFCAGIFIGFQVAYIIERHGLPSARLNIIAGILCAAIVICCWWLALTAAAPDTIFMPQ